MKKRFGLVFSFCLILSLVIAGTTSAAPAAKVDVCHIDDLGVFNKINVSENAFQAHVDHGDASPHEYVPGNAGWAFDGDCVPYLLGTDSVQVSSSGAVATSTLITKPGTQYKLTASGTYVYGGGWATQDYPWLGYADAKYSNRPGWTNPYGNFNGWVDGADLPSPWEYALQIEYLSSPVYWIETFNEAHIYTAYFTGNGSAIQFFIWDSGYSDNSGFLTVTINELP